jgi:hypothetical protein
MPIPAVQQNAVFLNFPYDARFSRLYLAYIVGLTELGIEPRATLGIPGGERRLNRILAPRAWSRFVDVRLSGQSYRSDDAAEMTKVEMNRSDFWRSSTSREIARSISPIG